MFTGLIEAVGHVGHMGTTDAGLRIRIRTAIAPDLSDGESVSVNGVCRSERCAICVSKEMATG